MQIASPSRSDVPEYREIRRELEAAAGHINGRYAEFDWTPVRYLNKSFNHRILSGFYRAAGIGLVTPFRDGMNLVAKEYVASRHDEDGVLVLSPFTGAAREFPDALIVNPYDTEAMADAIFHALEMEAQQRVARMRRMRAQVKHHNVYRWAGNLISELCDVRVGTDRRKLARPAAAGGAADEVVGQEFLDHFEDAGSLASNGDHVSM
jgi:trehalose 6-phosphate synthase